MTDDKPLVEQALELFVYAPLGVALTVRDNLPELVEKGRERMTGQVALARMVGQFAVAQGQREAQRLIKQAAETLGGLGVAGPARPPARQTSEPRQPAPPPPAQESPRPSSNGKRSSPAASGAHLAIPGYDSLSASQVVQRLAGLAPDELEAVRAYEEQTRGRRTILNKAAQLQSDRGS